nr:hypothetical protein [Candidatus Acidoferrales bacterium]
MSKPAWAFAVIAAFFAANAASAQDLPPLSNEFAPGTFPGSSAGRLVSAYPIVTGHPFRALTNSRSVMTMPDGTKRTHEFHGIVVRDGNGRLSSSAPESPHVPDGPNSDEFTAAGGSVTDPTLKISIQWDSASNTATKMKLLSSQMQPEPLNACEIPSGKPSGSRDFTNARVESLGNRTIQGIATVGCRVTRVVPVRGFPPDTPANTIVDESWSSPELRISLIHTHTESSGNSVLDRLDEIVREEPDPAVFEPPANYSVHDLDSEREKAEREAVPLIPDGPTPVMLAGPWEAQDPIKGAGTQLGLFLEMRATREVQRVGGGISANGSGKFRSLNIYIYQRTSGKEQVGGYISLDSGSDSLGTKWDGQRLQIKFKGEPRASFGGEFVLDLTFALPQEDWTGTYTSAAVTNSIRFQRPGAEAAAKPNPLIGLWALPDLQMGRTLVSRGCLQVAQSADGVYFGWFRRVDGPVNSEPGNGNRSQQYMDEFAGQRWEVTVDGPKITLDEGAFMQTFGGNGPEKFTGKLSADGSQIVGAWEGHSFVALTGTPLRANENSAEIKSPPTPSTFT